MSLRVNVGRDVALPLAMLGSAAGTLSIQLIPQEQREWCWAACLHMVMKFVDSSDTATQCTLASNAFGVAGCCTNPNSPICNKPLPVPNVVAEWSRYTFQSVFNNYAIEFTTIVNEINGNRPIEVGLKWQGPGGHAILIIGYDESTQKVLICNPQGDGYRGYIDYAELLNAFGQGQWQWTWTGIQRR